MTTQSVVTYTVIVDTENPDLRLYPYLTANASFQVEHRDNILKVPNGALRWKPRPEMVAPEYRSMLTSAGKEKPHETDRATTSSGKTAERSGDKNAKTSLDPKVSAALQYAKRHGGKDATAADDSKPTVAAGDTAKHKGRVERGLVWVKDGLLAKPVKVRIGMTDGIDTEISGEGIEGGTEVIVGQMTPDQAAAEMGNPFAPKIFKRSGGPAKGPS